MVGLYCSYNYSVYLLSLCKKNVVVWLFRGRSESWWSEVVLKTFTERQWIENFRMSHRTFLHLCDQLHPKLFRSDTHYRMAIPVKKRVAIALWFLATPGEYRTIAHLLVIENAYGRLKGRWRRLMKENEKDVRNIPIVISACCVLHNMCEIHGDTIAGCNRITLRTHSIDNLQKSYIMVELAVDPRTYVMH